MKRGELIVGLKYLQVSLEVPMSSFFSIARSGTIHLSTIGALGDWGYPAEVGPTSFNPWEESTDESNAFRRTFFPKYE